MPVTTDTLEALTRTNELRNTDIVHVMRDPDLVGRQDVALTGAHLLAMKGGNAPRGGIISIGASAVGTTQDNTGLALGTGDLSFGMWLQLPDWTPASGKTLFRKSTGAGALGLGVALNSNGTLSAYLGNGVGSTVYTSTAPVGAADETWVFLTWTLDRDGNLVFSANGAPVGTPLSIAAQSAQSLTSATAPLTWFSDSSSHVAGVIGETWIINGLLSASQVTNIYKAGSIAPFASAFTFFQWLDFGRGYGSIIPDLGNNPISKQPALMGTLGLSHAIPRNPPGTPQRAPRTALGSDGSNGSFIRSALGTQTPDTGDFTLWADFASVPVEDATSRVLAALSSSTSEVVQANALVLFSSSGLFIVRYGATTADNRSFALGSFFTHFAGKRVVIAVTRSSTTVKIFFGMDGVWVDATNLFTQGSSGTPPTWSDTINGAYLHAFFKNSTNSISGSLADLRLANVAMTEAQLRTEYERGEPGPEWQSASKTELVTNGDFATGVVPAATGWTFAASGTSTSANVAGVGVGGTNAAQLVVDGLNSAATIQATGFIHRIGQKYILTITAKADSTTGNPSLASDVFADFGINLTTDFVTYSRVVTATTAATLAQIKRGSGCEGRTITIDNVSIVAAGYTSRLRTDTAAGLTVLNGSKSATNDSTDFLLSPTGATTSPNGRRQIIRDTLTFGSAGNLQVKGAAVVDTSKKWRLASAFITSTAAISISLGNASGGAQYVNAHAVINGDTDLSTFVSRVISGANIWLNATGAAVLGVYLILEQVD